MYDIKLMRELITSAGERAMKHFRKVEPTWKENLTYVTDADLEVQEYLKEEFDRRFPEDGIIGEEDGLSKAPSSGERCWIIDPIDGTASFARGFPVWGIAIGLLTRSEAIGGFFYLPTTGDFYYTTPEGTVCRNGQIMHVKSPEPFCREAVLLAGPRLHRSCSIAPEYTGKIRSLGSTVAHLCYVATGSADAAFLQKVAVWDLAAGLAMVLQNNGVVEYFDGTPVSIEELIVNRNASQTMLVGHPETVKQYRKFLTLHNSVM